MTQNFSHIRPTYMKLGEGAAGAPPQHAKIPNSDHPAPPPQKNLKMFHFDLNKRKK